MKFYKDSLVLSLYCTLFFFTISCSSEPDRKNEVELVPTRDLFLPVDSFTQQYNPAICYVENHKEKFLAIYNSYNKKIYFYDIQNKVNFKTILLPIQNRGGIDTSAVVGFFLNNSDTIFIITADFQLHLFIEKTQQIQTINLSPFAKTTSFYFLPNNVSFPSYCYGVNLHRIEGNFLYLTGSMDDSWANPNQDKAGILIQVNLHNGTKKYLSNYPSIYKNSRWSIYFRMTFADYDSKENTFIYSFPACNDLYLIDSSGSFIKKKSGRTKYSQKKIKPVAESKWVKNIPTSRIDDNYFTNITYRYLMYDKFRNVYYRVVELPMNKYVPTYEDFKQYSIIILDSNLNIIGETLLPKGKKYIPEIMFISEAGLNILKPSKNEGLIDFVIFQLKRI